MAEGGLEGGAAVDMPAAHSLGHTADGADSPTSCCCPGDAGIVSLVPSGAHPAARAPEVSGSSKSTIPLTQRPGIRHHRFALTVPFPTSLEAEIACGSLAPDAEPHRGLLGKELKVNGCILEVHWISEDSRLLRISIMNFLDQLSLVVNTIRRFGPPVSR
ncbi:EKC/KEOPS complex subunit LAGE3 [Mesocricetus auratus]|uniref:L antigen family member 3 n=1 Tax=Mesocricetus auratus TaxID=10036 RepID=A0A1U7REA0_MESAU|nr:EKC/KEOPS complex subunit LAGE3 [Mesocricetus auratus]